MKGEVQNELGGDGSEHYETVEKRGRALHPQTSWELNNHPSPSEENFFPEGNNNKSEMSAEDDSVRHTEGDHVANVEVYIYDAVSREAAESYQTEGENNRFAQEEMPCIIVKNRPQAFQWNVKLRRTLLLILIWTYHDQLSHSQYLLSGPVMN